jgi:hypothetical protein
MKKTNFTESKARKLLIKSGFNVWGKRKPRPGNGSFYQCYRKGNLYIWLGEMYIERSDNIFALDYPYEGFEATKTFIGAK